MNAPKLKGPKDPVLLTGQSPAEKVSADIAAAKAVAATADRNITEAKALVEYLLKEEFRTAIAAQLRPQAPAPAPALDTTLVRGILADLREVLLQLMRHNETLTKIVAERPVIQVSDQVVSQRGPALPPDNDYTAPDSTGGYTGPLPSTTAPEIVGPGLPPDMGTYSSAPVFGGPPHGRTAADSAAEGATVAAGEPPEGEEGSQP